MNLPRKEPSCMTGTSRCAPRTDIFLRSNRTKSASSCVLSERREIRLLIALALLAALAEPARAQSNGVTSGNQVVPGHVEFCATGVTNADGSIAVAPCSSATPLSVTVGSQSNGTYPLGATAITGAGSGTTGAVAGTLAGVANATTYVCGFAVSAVGGTATIGPITIAGTLGSSLVYQAASSAIGTQLTQTFTPCVPASATNTSISITTTADGTATGVDVNAWGFQFLTSAGLPYLSTSLTGNATGSTGAVVGTLTGAASKTTYICGFSVSALGGAATVGPITIANTITGSLVYQLFSAASGNFLNQQFTPCIPANAANTNITVTTTADGTATAVDVNSWGFRQ
jgi:hypothetical protein